MTSPWQLWLLWGFAVGIGTGSLALVFGAIVANRWFVRHRGVVIGVFSAASSTGQLVFLPGDRRPRRRPRMAVRGGPGRRLRPAPGARRARCCCATPPPTSAPRRTARTRHRPVPRPRAAPGRGAAALALDDAARLLAQRHVLDPGRHLLDLRLVDQRPDRHPLHPGGPRPRHARDDQRDAAGADRRLRHHRHRRQRLADRPGRQPLPAVRLLRLPRPLAAARADAPRPRTSSPACSSSSCSTGSTGWRPSRRRWRCAASTSGSSGPASSSAGCSPPTWSAPGSQRASRLDPHHPGRLPDGLAHRGRSVPAAAGAACWCRDAGPRVRLRQADPIWRTPRASVKIVRLLRRVAGVHHILTTESRLTCTSRWFLCGRTEPRDPIGPV